MFGVFDLLVCIGIGVGISWAEQDAFAEVHQAHQNAGAVSYTHLTLPTN